jgi:hypothetical protein
MRYGHDKMCDVVSVLSPRRRSRSYDLWPLPLPTADLQLAVRRFLGRTSRHSTIIGHRKNHLQSF